MISDARRNRRIASVPWNRTVQKSDSWYSYRCEQDQLVNYIVDNDITGVVLISGDIHTAGAIDDGGNSLCPEMSVPNTNAIPVACEGQSPCGDWECNWGTCYATVGVGYGIVDVNPSAGTATLTTKRFVSGTPYTFSLILQEGNTCTAP